MPLTIESILMLELVNRMKNIVNGIAVRYGVDNKALVSVFVASGSLTVDGPIKVTAEVKPLGVVEFTYNRATVSHDFSIASTFDLFSTGYTLEVADTTVLYEGDTYDIRCNKSTETLVDVRTWKQANVGTTHPFLEVYPGEFVKNNNRTSDRRNVTATYDLKLEFDFGRLSSDNDAVLIMEVCGDIENEIQRDPRFIDEVTGLCRVIDTQVVNVAPFISQANDDLAGAFISLEMEYRTNLKDSRKL